MPNMSDQGSKVETREEMLDRVQTTGAISISPQLFEQLYLGPKNEVKGQLRQTLGNPTPIGMISLPSGRHCEC